MKYRTSHDLTPPIHQLDPLAKVKSHLGSPEGAPYGRPNVGEPPASGVRLFALVLSKSGHDKGGAFWGHGGRVYCATDYKTYAAYYQQDELTREQAAQALGLTPEDLLLKQSNR